MKKLQVWFRPDQIRSLLDILEYVGQRFEKNQGTSSYSIVDLALTLADSQVQEIRDILTALAAASGDSPPTVE